MTYAWIAKSAEGVETWGPYDITDSQHTALRSGEGEPFRVYNDDGDLDYTGRILGDYDGFEPLDDWCRADYGSTEIHYRNKETGNYERL